MTRAASYKGFARNKRRLVHEREAMKMRRCDFCRRRRPLKKLAVIPGFLPKRLYRCTNGHTCLVTALKRADRWASRALDSGYKRIAYREQVEAQNELTNLWGEEYKM